MCTTTPATETKPTTRSKLEMAARGEAEDIDGKAIAKTIRGEVKSTVADLQANHGVTPGLAVILVGERRDSQTYVRMKKKACEECGIASFGFDFDADVTEEVLMQCIHELNAREDVHGILVQLPLPSHIDEKKILNTLDPAKDVDGLHPLNAAGLFCGLLPAPLAAGFGSGQNLPSEVDFSDLSSVPFHIPCTPQGCIELLDRSGVELKGANAVVLGRSNLVGLPVAMLLTRRDATVTVAHSKTADIEGVVRQADIVVAAVGRALLVKSSWLKPGCVVIDVGINSVDDPAAKRGYRLVGDVDYESARQVASKITPVPGGVGPMTIAMLLRNTLNAARRRLNVDTDSADKSV